MPGLPKPMTKKAPAQAPVEPSAEASKPREMSLGSLRVGANGITVGNPEDAGQLPPNLVSLDDLVSIKELGKGASGTVGLFKHKVTHERYAVKKINVSGKASRESAMAGIAEIRSIFAPAPNAVRLFNAFVRDGHLLLIMEYMDGGSLEELLEKQKQLPEAAASYLAHEMLSALSSLHRKNAVVDQSREKKTVHRDIKPANVLLSRDADIKVADFGVAGSADSIGLASFVGTATYMSPERIKGQRYGTESDIWSVGIVIAQVLLGRYPFAGVNSGFMALLKEVTTTQRLELPSEFSTEAQDFLDQCLKQDASQRTAAEKLLEHPWILRHTDDAKTGANAFREVMSVAGIARQHSTVSPLLATSAAPQQPAPAPQPPAVQ